VWSAVDLRLADMEAAGFYRELLHFTAQSEVDSSFAQSWNPSGLSRLTGHVYLDAALRLDSPNFLRLARRRGDAAWVVLPLFCYLRESMAAWTSWAESVVLALRAVQAILPSLMRKD